ncbi:MAG: M24 family metallopeptidase [Thermomicrobiales bacterium]
MSLPERHPSAQDVRSAIATSMATTMDTERRRTRLRERFAALPDPIDALVVTDLRNIRYLTGFTGGAGILAITLTGVTLVTDGRYGERAEADLAAHGTIADLVVTREGQRDAIASALNAAARIGLEALHVTWDQQRRYQQEWFPGKELVPTVGVVERLRQVKDTAEVARIRAAALLADHVLQVTVNDLVPGMSEREIQWLLDDRMRALGSEEPAFPTIVASGTNASLPHHRPSDRPLADGDLLTIDFGGVVDGYRSDITRTLTIGDVPAESRGIVDIVREAEAAGVAAVAAGKTAEEIDRVCRDLITEAGYGDRFIHSTGHSIGLVTHEPPFLMRGVTYVLAPGMVVTVEPGIYVPGLGGCRIEDLVVVTEDGCDVLSGTPRTLTR